MDISRDTKVNAVVFQRGTSCSYITTVGELIDEINHYQAFWLSSVGHEYTNKPPSSNLNPHVVIKVCGLTREIRNFISNRLRG